MVKFPFLLPRVSGLAVASAGLLLGCTKPAASVIVPLSLVAPATVVPPGATLALGDTLWLEAAFSDSLRDLTSGKRYRIQPQDLPLSAGFVVDQLHGPGQKTTGFANTFQVAERVGKAAVNGEYTGSFSLVYDGQAYHTKLGLIPTKRGVATVSLLLSSPGGASSSGSFLPFLKLPPDAQGREQKPVLAMLYFVINEGKTTNYDVYRQQFTIDPEASGAPASSLFYGRNSTFTVEIK